MEKRYKHKKRDAKYENTMSNELFWPDERISEVYPNYHQGDSIIKKEMIEASPIALEHPHFKYKEDYRLLKLRASSVGSYSSGTDSSECYSPPEKYATMTFHNLEPCFEASNSSMLTTVPEDAQEASVKEIQESEKDGTSLMTNMGFFKRVDPLHTDLSEASVRLQSFLGSCTENGLDRSTLFKQLKSSFTPFVDDFSNVLGSIPRVLSSTYEPVRGSIEIGNACGKYSICQPSFEKAVSKYSIKDASVALVECDMFLTKKEKLESTIGRESSSSGSGNKLKPLDPAKLAALYHIIADKKRMPNIQRTQDCLLSSPDFLTVKEQKMVREALSQYFNQLRQRQKRKRSNPDSFCTSSKEEPSAE